MARQSLDHREEKDQIGRRRRRRIGSRARLLKMMRKSVQRLVTQLRFLRVGMWLIANTSGGGLRCAPFGYPIWRFCHDEATFREYKRSSGRRRSSARIRLRHRNAYDITTITNCLFQMLPVSCSGKEHDFIHADQTRLELLKHRARPTLALDYSIRLRVTSYGPITS